MSTATISADEAVARLSNGLSLRCGVYQEGDTPYRYGDYVRLCAPDGAEQARWHALQWAKDPIGVMAAIMTAAAGDQAQALMDNEVVVKLVDGSTMRSGVYEQRQDSPISGEYVRVCDESGEEYLYWDSSEWADDPEFCMGAIISCVSGLRVVAV